MPVVAKCSCGKKYALDDSMIGQKAKCRACGKLLRIPTKAEIARKTGAGALDKQARPVAAAAPRATPQPAAVPSRASPVPARKSAAAPPRKSPAPRSTPAPSRASPVPRTVAADDERPARRRARGGGGAGKLGAVALVVILVGAAAGYMLTRKDGAAAPGGGANTSGGNDSGGEGNPGAPVPGPEGPVPVPAAALVKTELDREGLEPCAVVASPDGKTLYVAEAAEGQVAAFDVSSGKVTKAFRLPDPPGGVALSPDGARLYVTGAVPAGKVHTVDTKSGEVTGSVAVGHTPVAVALSPDGRTLYVCNRFTNDVSVVDVGAAKETARIPVVREPFAAVVTPDGRQVFVANLLPLAPADGDYVATTVSVIDAAAGKVTATIQLPNGSEGVRGICASPDGRHVYAVHILARFQLPTTQLERGWMNTNALSVIDAAERKLINTVLLDDVDNGAANPWAVRCTADGKYICVTHAGTHELSVIDRAALHEKLDKVARGEKVSDASASAEDVPNDLAFLVGLRRRLRLEGKGPRSLALVGTKAHAGMFFSDTLCEIDIAPEARPAPKAIALGPEEPMSVARKGASLFNDANICFQHWQSCASCHPDTRPDGLNWDLLNDGLGNPKNASSMLNAHRTPPVMLLGVRADAETAVRAGIKFILFSVRPEEDAKAIDEYLKALKPVPSPHLVDGKLSEAAVRGAKVFEKAGCSSCHSGPFFTDMRKHNIGLGIGLDEAKEFDTQALVEIWRTAPYLYDGRAKTIEEVVTKHNAGDTHGTTSDLSPKEIDDLVKFVLSQ